MFACVYNTLTLLHSEWPKLHRVLAFLSAIGLMLTSGFKSIPHALGIKNLMFALTFKKFKLVLGVKMLIHL